MSTHPLVIAIDGPAASGKGTLARKIAARYGLPYLDTGLTYRAVACAMLKQKLDMTDEAAAVKIAEKLDLSALDAAALSAHEIGEAASKIAVLPLLRHALVNAQHRFAANPAGAVLDGRDIGTVVCPDADIKLYIVADVEERAKRRYKEIVAKGGAAVYGDILADLQRRDARDMNRAASPLRPADDALLLNTTKLSIEEAFFAACKLIDAQKS